MRLLWAALVIGTVSACVESPESERTGASTGIGPDRGDAASGGAGFEPAAPRPTTELAFEPGRDAASDSQDDAGGDSDAGADAAGSELERAFVYDCTETLRCMERPANNIPACVRSVREALTAASPQTQKVFLDSVRRCRREHDCDYVDCVSQS